jgi:hypothetical protein
VTFADWYTIVDQTLPFVGAGWFALWLKRDLAKAQHQIAEMATRCKQLEELLTADDTVDEDLIEIGFEPASAEPLPLPRPLPPAIARYRS